MGQIAAGICAFGPVLDCDMSIFENCLEIYNQQEEWDNDNEDIESNDSDYEDCDDRTFLCDDNSGNDLSAVNGC